MRHAILCPGPSLNDFNSADQYDCITGVNAAAEVHPCDWWCAVDEVTLHNVKPMRPPDGIITYSKNSFIARKRHPGCQVVGTEVLAETLCRFQMERVAKRMGAYGAVIALAFVAGWLGAKHADVYGCDMYGSTYHDGAPIRGSRASQGWEFEISKWNELADALKDYGVTFNRVRPKEWRWAT